MHLVGKLSISHPFAVLSETLDLPSAIWYESTIWLDPKCKKIAWRIKGGGRAGKIQK
jgi:hypothetical protein